MKMIVTAVSIFIICGTLFFLFWRVYYAGYETGWLDGFDTKEFHTNYKKNPYVDED